MLSISLVDLLEENSAPAHIDYISIDTEGSEYEILSDFPFSKFTFGMISVEHNFNANREHIFNLLTTNGYVRILESVSNYDDWYVNPKYVDMRKLAID